MSKKTIPKDMAYEIYELVGEKKNILKFSNCITRLRISILDMSCINAEKIKKIVGVIGIVEKGSQLHIIIGPGRVNKVAYEFGLILSANPEEISEAFQLKGEVESKKTKPFKLLFKKICGMFS